MRMWWPNTISRKSTGDKLLNGLSTINLTSLIPPLPASKWSTLTLLKSLRESTKTLACFSKWVVIKKDSTKELSLIERPTQSQLIELMATGGFHSHSLARETSSTWSRKIRMLSLMIFQPAQTIELLLWDTITGSQRSWNSTLNSGPTSAPWATRKPSPLNPLSDNYI